MPGATEVQYLVLPDATDPYLLARVRWPDVFQAISAGRPDWQDDPGLFDLPYDPSSTTVTHDQAAAIAARWGAVLPTADTARTFEASLIRRMPADWSNLAPAEKRAWSLELVNTGRRARPEGSQSPSGVGALAAWLRRPRTRRPAVSPLLAQAGVEREGLILDLAGASADALTRGGSGSPLIEPASAMVSTGTDDGRAEEDGTLPIGPAKVVDLRAMSLRRRARHR